MSRLLVIAAAVAVLLIPVRVPAGVVGSPHDLASQGYIQLPDKREKKEKSSVCDNCHVPHKAKGARLWATTPPSLEPWGDVGPICYSCHDGVAIVSPHADASTTAFHPKSHGLDINELPDGDDVSESELPYTTGDVKQNIECSTCHNPHDNTIRPFVRAELNELCQKCHKNRENSGYMVNNAEGTHPVHKLAEDEVAGMSPIDVQDPFKVPFPQNYPSEKGKKTEKVHWTLGGHLAEGDDGTIECVTCHSVHGKEPTGPPGDPVLSMDPVKKFSNEFCEGCHRGERSDGLAEPPFPNPGGTPFYHPVDNDIGNGEGRIIEIVEPEGWELGGTGEILCTTCHQAHGGMENSPMLRQPYVAKTFCEECHSVPFNHHPTGTGTLADPSSGKMLARTRQIIIPEDVPIGYTWGEPEEGAMYCSSCHGAHNLQCKLLYVAECIEGELQCTMCLDCHPKFNPTWQTNDDYKSTHFMGDPMSPFMDTVDLTTGNVDQEDGQPGFYDQHPPVKEGPWPESGLESRYGGDNGYEITCCSCHNFSPGNLVGGNADQRPYNSSDPYPAPGYIESDLTSGLLARAGQYKEWLVSDEELQDLGGNRGTVTKVDKYLCTGCHGLTPNSHPTAQNGEGMTHPLMNANGSNIDPLDDFRFTYNKHVNCETCHSVHEADSRGGFYILKEIDFRPTAPAANDAVVDPYVIRTRDEVEYVELCHKCHIDY